LQLLEVNATGDQGRAVVVESSPWFTPLSICTTLLLGLASYEAQGRDGPIIARDVGPGDSPD
jgi:hypothetical protein